MSKHEYVILLAAAPANCGFDLNSEVACLCNEANKMQAGGSIPETMPNLHPEDGGRGQKAVRIISIDDTPEMHEVYRKILVPRQGAGRQDNWPGMDIEGPAAPLSQLPTFTLDCASQGREALEMVTEAQRTGHPYAVAFVDMRMPPGWNGIETIEQLWKVDPALETVICTGFIDFSADDILRRLRRTDQVLLLKKPFDEIEVRLLAFALSEKWQLAREARSHFENLEDLIKARTRELEQSISMIKASENQYRLLFESNPTPIYTFDQETLVFLDVNEAAVLHYGYSKEDFQKMTLRDIALPDEVPAFLEKLSKWAALADLFGRLASSDEKRQTHGKMEVTSHPLGNPKTVAVAGGGCDGTIEP